MANESISQGVAVAGSAAVGIVPLLSTAAWAVPVVGAAVAAVTLAVTLLLNRKGGQQRIQTSNWANDAERLLQDNLAAFERNKTAASQAAALANFDRVWGELVRLCGNPAEGRPGQACINDRRAGGKFDWFAAYRTPIERASLASGDGVTTGGVGVGGVPWWVIGMGLGGVLLLASGDQS